MNFIKSLFSRNEKTSKHGDSRLIALLEIYKKQPSNKNSYSDIIYELLNGTSYLLLPSENDNPALMTTEIADNENTTLKLSCIFNVDGIIILVAFTDEISLLSWSKDGAGYTAMPSVTVLKICEDNNIDRVVINSGLPTQFVLERDRKSCEQLVIEQGTNIKFWKPSTPLDYMIIEKLIEHFKQIEVIEEVYQCEQMHDNKISILLSFKLLIVSENVKNDIINAVQATLSGKQIGQSIDLSFLQAQDYLDAIRSVQDSLIYKKQ